MRPALAAIKTHWVSFVLVPITAMFVYQHFQLVSANKSLKLRILTAASEQVQIGDRLGELAGTTIGDVYIRRTVAGFIPGSLVMGLSARCGVCSENRETWRRVSDQARSRGLQVIWVGRDRVLELIDFLDPASAADAMIAEPTHPTYLQVKLNLVPQTLVINAKGIVEYARTGPIRSADGAAVIRTMDKLIEGGARR
jgi:hypothetical protein